MYGTIEQQHYYFANLLRSTNSQYVGQSLFNN